jgi:hydrogenase nickel incorporation protein HypB
MNIITIEEKFYRRMMKFHLRTEKFSKNGLFTINIVSSPGSGKTSLIEKTIERLKNEIKIAVIEGDVQADLDAESIRL